MFTTKPTSLFAAALLGTLTAPAFAQDDREVGTPTAAYWYHGRTAAQVGALYRAGHRFTDIEVEKGAPLTLSVATVKNTGAFKKTWTYLLGHSPSFINSTASRLGMRVIDIEPYYSGSKLLFAAILIKNTGKDAAGWWHYYGTNPGFIAGKFIVNKARLIDLEEYKVRGKSYYAAVMIRNDGVHKRRWGYRYNISSSALSALLTKDRVRIHDRDVSPSGGYNVITVEPRTRWGHWYNVTASYALSLQAKHKMRMVDLELKSNVGGVKRFDIVVVHNGTPGTFTKFGSSCRSSYRGYPEHKANSKTPPEVNRQVQYLLTGGNYPTTWSSPSTLNFGTSKSRWGSLRLPFHLSGFGAPGCYIRTDWTIQIPVTMHFGTAYKYVKIPNNPSLIGQSFHTQWTIADRRANAAGLVTTNGLTTKIGGPK